MTRSIKYSNLQSLENEIEVLPRTSESNHHNLQLIIENQERINENQKRINENQERINENQVQINENLLKIINQNQVQTNDVLRKEREETNSILRQLRFFIFVLIGLKLIKLIFG